MTASLDKLSAARALDLARDGLSRQGAPASLPDRLLVVDAERQVATWLEGGKPVAAWPVSTARNGIGGAEGSFRTPPGWHAIRRRIGEQAALGAVFVSRQRTGERWCGEARVDDLILTRILTLDGLEEGVNRGDGCDLRARYIYLHGTNHEEMIGRTASHGCVRMFNRDVVELFARVREGDLVLIAAPEFTRPARSQGPRAVSLRRSRRFGHERACPVPGDDRRQSERQRPGLRPRRAGGDAI